jgi:hypothetical protein
MQRERIDERRYSFADQPTLTVDIKATKKIREKEEAEKNLRKFQGAMNEWTAATITADPYGSPFISRAMECVDCRFVDA